LSYQVFVSYTRDDNEPGHDGMGEGFVTTLLRHIEDNVREFGIPRDQRPKLWLDTRNISDSDLFDKVLTDELDASDVLLVVLTPNWVSRPYCQKELAYFARKYHTSDDAKQHIVIAAKVDMDPDRDRPELLRGQNAFCYYDEDRNHPGQMRVFFKNGTIVDQCQQKFFDKTESLARNLVNRVGKTERPAARETQGADAKSKSPGITVYVAKPAGDMDEKYGNLVKELENNGFAVVPSIDFQIPHLDGNKARESIDEQLAQARLSIHLLGKEKGYAPPNSPEIVELQMARAREQVEKSEAGENAFRRIIWAPKELREAGEKIDDVVASFGGAIATDKLVDDERAAFHDFIIQHLRAAFPAPGFGAAPKLAAKSRVYVDFQEDDWEYALAIGNALKQRQIMPVAPTFQGDPQQARLLNAKALADVDAVILCWSKAVETWVKTEYASWADWRELGRNQEFACRGLVAGPPPGREKMMLTSWSPSDSIDVILDLTQQQLPLPPDALDPIVEAAMHRENEGAAD